MSSSIQGGSFWTGAASGFVGNVTGLATAGVSPAGRIVTSAVMGGVTSGLTGGEFWQGAAIGGIVAGTNHVLHGDPLQELERRLRIEARQFLNHLREIGEFPYDMVMGSKDFMEVYIEMRKADLKDSDKYFHSKANYKASLRGYGGEFVAARLSNFREFLDQRWPKFDSRADALADQKANSYGRSRGIYNRSNYGRLVDYKYAIPDYRRSYFGNY